MRVQEILSMKWSRIKESLCPKCTSRTMLSFGDGYLTCRCGFRISEQRMTEIVSSIVSKDLEQDDYQPCRCGMTRIACKCYE